MPCPLSWICRSLRPPSLTITLMCVDLASMQFSIISLRAFAGRSTTSPAAILFTTVSSSFWMRLGSRAGGGTEPAADVGVAVADAVWPELGITGEALG